MLITRVDITLKDEDRLKAYADVIFDGEFIIRGIKVISRGGALTVAMPSRRRTDGTYQDIVSPVSGEVRSRLGSAVLEAYRKAAGDPD